MSLKRPNEITSLGAAMTLLFHVVAHWRGASEFYHWAPRPETTI